ncbi:MAG: phosphate ABC transporter permease PstA [Chitinivibrionales bacterium]|nr:phosphate ABC transporter permease PstA [Chitinivibrionales bacterium]
MTSYFRKHFFRFAVPAAASFCAFAIVAVVVMITANIIILGAPHISWEFITQPPRAGMTQGGIFPAIIGTFLLVIIMSIAGVPIGTVTALYLAEYVSKKSIIVKFIRFAVNTLAGIPSIVFGLFGLGFFIRFVGKGMDSLLTPGEMIRWGQPNIMWASLTMAILTLPVVIVSVEEAIRAVPRELREASLALGATRWETIRNLVLPNSVTGILTGAILAISRGAGEVAPILFTGAAYFLPHLPHSLNDQFMHLGYHIYIMSTQSPDVDATRGIQFATTLVLLALTFSLSFIAIVLRFHLRRKIIRL